MMKKEYISPKSNEIQLALPLLNALSGTNAIQYNEDKSLKSVGIFNEEYNSETDEIF